MTPKVFICHASEDKDEAARPLAGALRRRGHDVWYDEYALELGDSLRRQIEQGLATCDFGVVILSLSFFAKEWPQKELDGLVGKESPTRKVILPIWHKISQEEVSRFSPMLAERVAARTADGLDAVVQRIERAITTGVAASNYVSSRAQSPFLLKLRVSGAVVSDQLLPLFKRLFGANEDQITEAVITLYNDGSGIDDDASHVLLKSGAKWFPDEDPVLLFAVGLVPELPSGFTAVGWSIPESSWYARNSLHLRDHEVEVLFARELKAVKLESVADYAEAIVAYDKDPHDKMWWDSLSVGRVLVRELLRRSEFNLIERLLKNPVYSGHRGLFLLGRAVVEELDPRSAKSANGIVAALLDAQSPLNEHWKGTLKRRLGLPNETQLTSPRARATKPSPKVAGG